MARICSCIAVASLIGALPAAALATTITEATFLAVLTDEHPAVVALGERLAAAERAAGSSYVDNPSFEFFFETPDGEPSQSTWALTWKPPLDGQRGLRKKVGAAQLAVARSEFAAARLELRAAARAVYTDWWRLTELEALLATHVQSVDRLAARSELRVERGEESGLDAGRLRFAAAEMAAALATLRAELARTRAAVRVFAPDLPAAARPERPHLAALPENRQPGEHPEIASRRHAVEGARLENKRSGRVIEFPQLAAGWTRISGDGADADGPVIGLEWNLPLFDRRQGDRAMAARNLVVAEARLRTTIAATEARRSAARAAYETLRQAALDLQSATTGATLLITAATSAFDNNETSVTDLLEALRSILSGRQAAIDLYHEALVAHRQLETSAGRPLTSTTSGGSR